MKRSNLLILGAMTCFLSVAFAPIQLLPTNLKITVLNELGNSVEEATVKIYDAKEDYLNSANPVDSLVTNAKGTVKFKNLKPIVYYIEVSKDKLKNDGLGSATDALAEGRTNTVNVVIQ